jgi:hypothetical protein
MDWLLAFVSAWWWLIVAAAAAALIVVLAVALFAGSKGPHPKIVIHDEEKTFVDAKSGAASIYAISPILYLVLICLVLADKFVGLVMSVYV